jgi:RecB family exonuclease
MHSSLVGGSTAKRLINCPGSAELVKRAPPQVESIFALEGTKLHDAVERGLKGSLMATLGLTVEQQQKVEFCMEALDQFDPEYEGRWVTEQRLTFSWDSSIFGTADVVGRVGDTTYIVDWKFGANRVEAEENEQLLFYAAALCHTRSLDWAFQDSEKVVLVIVQPFGIRAWETTWARVQRFESDLIHAVGLAKQPGAPLRSGDHCRWCPARGFCPQMTGEVERLTRLQLESLDEQALARALSLAQRLESFIDAAKDLAQARLEADLPVPGFKLVAKRAVRKWADEARAREVLGEEFIERSLMTPAAVEKVLKQRKLTLPDDLVVAVSSGSTVVAESDPRPAVLNVGRQLTAALSKVV